MLDKINIDILKNITLISFVVVLFCLSCFAIIKTPQPIFIAVVFLIMCIAFVILFICCLLFLYIILNNGIIEKAFEIIKEYYFLTSGEEI